MSELETEVIKKKKELLNTVLNKENMTKVEKMIMIESHQLLPVHYYMINIFEEELKVLRAEKPGIMFKEEWEDRDYDRHRIIFFSSILERYATEDINQKHTVVFYINTEDRKHIKMESAYEMTYSEIENRLYDIMITDEICGMTFDW